MELYSKRRLLSIVVLMIGLSAGLSSFSETKATDYNSLTVNPTPVVELVPANKALPVRMVACRPVRSL